MISRFLLLAAVLCSLPLPAPAQTPTAAAERGGPSEPAVRRTVIEDDNARIEELRVRGAVRSVTVRPKGALQAEYEIVTPDAGRDLTAGPNSSRGAAGQSVWRVLQF